MSETSLERSLRVLYAAGPGDVAGTLRHWGEGRDDPHEIAMTYSGQFFDVCREMGVDALVVATNPRPADETHGRVRVIHRTPPFRTRGGLLWHAGQVMHVLRLCGLAMRHRADAVVAADLTHWFALLPLRLTGVALVPSLHCVLWPVSGPRGRVQRAVNRLNRACFRRWSRAILSISEDVSGQVRQIAGGDPRPIVPFIPTYRGEDVPVAPRMDPRERPFRVLYAGRIERNKGVFDLLEAAAICRERLGEGVVFDLCGEGSAMAELRAAAEARGLAATFRLHGHQQRDAMRRMFAGSHAVVVPTTTDFIEGFNKVVSESVLMGRPCVTSRVCPAMGYVRDAVVEAEPDDAGSYAAAIVRLAEDAELYEAKRRACVALREPFLDASRGWGAAVRGVLRGLVEPRRDAAAAAVAAGAGEGAA